MLSKLLLAFILTLVCFGIGLSVFAVAMFIPYIIPGVSFDIGLIFCFVFLILFILLMADSLCEVRVFTNDALRG